MSRPPNLVIVNADQWRGDVMGHLGAPAAVTPNLDRLVEHEAVSFRHAYCQSPVCVPSRCCFMSGWYPHVRGHRSMRYMLRPPDDNNLLKTLKDGGYHIWWGGKNDLVPAEHGFDDYCHVKYASHYSRLNDPNLEPPRPLYTNDRADQWRHPGTDDYYSFLVGRIDKGDAPYYRDWDWANVEGAVRMIHDAPDDRPLCIYLCLVYPHPPYGVEDPWYSMIDRDALPERIAAPDDWTGKCSFMPEYHRRLGMSTWTEDRWRELRAVYYGMAARVDHQLGLILDALRQRGIYDQTAFLFHSDHGDFAGDYSLVEKSQICFEDCLVRVPLVIKPPRDVPVQPRVCDALVELTDIVATVEALTGLRLPQTHFGRSLLPLVAGQTDTHRDAVVCEGGGLEGEAHFPHSDAPLQPDPTSLYHPRQSMQADDITFIGKAVMLRTERYKLVQRVYEDDELYDLRDDPAELHNRIHDLAYRDTLATLRHRLLRFLVETADIVPRDFNERE